MWIETCFSTAPSYKIPSASCSCSAQHAHTHTHAHSAYAYARSLARTQAYNDSHSLVLILCAAYGEKAWKHAGRSTGRLLAIRYPQSSTSCLVHNFARRVSTRSVVSREMEPARQTARQTETEEGVQLRAPQVGEHRLLARCLCLSLQVSVPVCLPRNSRTSGHATRAAAYQARTL